MNSNAREPVDERYAELLAAAEEALISGSTSLPSPEGLSPEVRLDLERDLACIAFLRRTLPQQNDDGDDTLQQPPQTIECIAGAELPWTHVGRFQILRELGRGAFGVVYLALDPTLGRTVALKVPQGHALIDAGLRARFQREARAAAGLEHANVVPVYESGAIGPVCYIASAYCPGPTLARWLKDRDRPLPFRQAAEIIAQLAEGVEHAHRNGVVHRDLKPGNVLLSPTVGGADGPPDNRSAVADDLSFVPRITDFGLARLVRGDEAACQTRTDALVGTPAYMAPEQASGHSRETGPATDVYALGAILYELLTGRPPFQAESVVETLLLVRTEEPVRPARMRPRVPRDLETVCLRAMAKSPARRYATAGQLAADLRRWLAGKPIVARPVGAWERAVKWARRRPAVAALIALTTLVTSLGFAGVTWQWQRAEATAEELDRRLYFHHIARAAAEMAANNMRLADELLDACSERLRGWEWHYVRGLRYGSRPALQGHTSAVHAVSIHPNGRLLASAGEDNTILIWDLSANAPPRKLEPHSKQVRVVVFGGPDGRFLASGGFDGKIIVWSTDDWHIVHEWREPGKISGLAFHPEGRRLAWRDWETGAIKIGDIESRLVRLTRCVPPNDANMSVGSLVFSADGRRLAATHGNLTTGEGEVIVWDMPSEEKLLTLPGPIGASGVTFSPDGRYLAAAGGTMWRADSDVIIWEARSGRVIHRKSGSSGMAVAIAFSPDGRRLATGGRDKIIKLWDVESGLEALVLHGHVDTVRALAFSRDGRYLVSGSADPSIRLWNATPLEDINPPEVATLKEHSARLGAVAYSPDGRNFASAGLDGRITVWDARSHVKIRTLQKRGAGVLGIAYSHDGRMLAAGSEDGTVKIWDVETGQDLPAPPNDQNWVSSVAFSPDGRLASTGALSVTSTDATIRLWDAMKHKKLPPIENAHSWFIQSVAFSPNGRWLASTGADGKVKVWDGMTGESVKPIIPSRKGRGLCLAFSPDSQRLAYAGLNNAVTIFDTSTWRELVPFVKHTDQVNSVVFSPDGRRVASAGNDATIRVWNAETGEEIAILRGHADWVESVAFSPDGRTLVSGSLDRTVKVWKAPP